MTSEKTILTVLLIVLAKPALQDWKKRRLRERELLIYSYTGILTSFLRAVWLGEILNWTDAVILTIILLLLYFLGKGQIGEGDIWVLGGLPLLADGKNMWEILIHTSVLLLAASAASYAEERDKTEGLPFVLFLWAGILITWGGKWLG